MEKIMFKKALTHGGVFHADDVFSAALLKILNPEIEIVRVFKVPDEVGPETIVFDIGLGAYDHHQEDGDVRPDGIKFAAFGLLWREFGHLILNSRDCGRFDKCFVEPIDRTDNEGSVAAPNPLSNWVHMMNPIAGTEESVDRQFELAVEMAKAILEREFEYYRKTSSIADEVMELGRKCEDGILLMKDHYRPYEILSEEEFANVKFVIFPSLRGGYNLVTISKKGTKEPRCPFAAELQTGTMGASFVHVGRFLAAFDSIEDARKAAEASLAQQQ